MNIIGSRSLRVDLLSYIGRTMPKIPLAEIHIATLLVSVSFLGWRGKTSTARKILPNESKVMLNIKFRSRDIHYSAFIHWTK